MSTATNMHICEGSDKPSVLTVLRNTFRVPKVFLNDKLYLEMVKFGGFRFYSPEQLFQEFKFREKHGLDLPFIDLGSIASGMGHTIVLTFDSRLKKFYFKHDGGNDDYERFAKMRFYTGLFFDGSTMVKKKPTFDATKLKKEFFIGKTDIWYTLGHFSNGSFYREVPIAGSFL